MKQLRPERLDDLVLARLSIRGAKAPTESSVARALYSFVSRELRQNEWQSAFSEALERLRERQLIDEKKLELTERGRERLAAALRLRKVPSADTWPQFCKRYLPRVFVTHPEAYGDASPNCAAALLAERLEVPCGASTTPRQVVDAWLTRKLGIDALSLDQLRNALLARELQLPRRKNAAETLRLSIAHLSGAPSAQAAPVLAALTTRWLRGDAPDIKAGDVPAERSLAPVQDELGRFVDRVQAAADGPEVRRYGDNKVFIGSVWQALSADTEIRKLGEVRFKQLLMEAHRRGALVLARADLASAMDPRDVRASEIKHHNATFHFIHRGQSA